MFRFKLDNTKVVSNHVSLPNALPQTRLD
jgi:hypothetical protein